MVQYIDFDYCNLAIISGSTIGAGNFQLMTYFVNKVAHARDRGMKLIVIDPRMSSLASKADLWVPIRPATDLALVLGIINLLLNVFKVYDKEFLKSQTNAPYLVKDDGDYLRGINGKPLIWDSIDFKAKPYDDTTIKDVALDGEFIVNGSKCKTAFNILKNKVKQYDIKWVSRTTTVPEDVIYEIARQICSEARIGSTINLNGRILRYRPVAFFTYSRAQAHTNGTLLVMAEEILNQIIGSLGAVGGILRKESAEKRVGLPPVKLSRGKDGLATLHVKGWYIDHPFTYPPESFGLKEFYPLSLDVGPLDPIVILEPEKYGVNIRPKGLLTYHANPLTDLNPEIVEKAIQKIDFHLNINIYLDEIAHFADIVLPEHCYLERYNVQNFDMDTVGLQISQPVVKPLYNTMDGIDILIELAERAECLYGPGGFYDLLNKF
ncbi:MAG: molybdopterin-dependent oxidoreductase, partial [Candidatus Micrarchaeia archaeon]